MILEVLAEDAVKELNRIKNNRQETSTGGEES